MIRRTILFIVLLLLAFFLDGSIAFSLSVLSHYQFVFSSHLLLLILLYAGSSLSAFWLYPMLVILGIFYDAYYFGTLGVSIWLFPFCLYLIRVTQPYRRGGKLEQCLLMIGLVFAFSGLTYAVAFFNGLTRYPVERFVIYNLLPSIVLNVFYALLAHKVLMTWFPLSQDFAKS